MTKGYKVASDPGLGEHTGTIGPVQWRMAQQHQELLACHNIWGAPQFS